ncbi:MAG TPA: hypothetical protein VFD10_01855 [Atribacterota bacterium]|nr:hypothetical protein [Atribacterota bacterium]
MSLHDFWEILLKEPITNKAATIYAILEAKAAPEIPHLGISNKFQEIFAIKNT